MFYLNKSSFNYNLQINLKYKPKVREFFQKFNDKFQKKGDNFYSTKYNDFKKNVFKKIRNKNIEEINISSLSELFYNYINKTNQESKSKNKTYYNNFPQIIHLESGFHKDEKIQCDGKLENELSSSGFKDKNKNQFDKIILENFDKINNCNNKSQKEVSDSIIEKVNIEKKENQTKNESYLNLNFYDEKRKHLRKNLNNDDNQLLSINFTNERISNAIYNNNNNDSKTNNIEAYSENNNLTHQIPIFNLNNNSNHPKKLQYNILRKNFSFFEDHYNPHNSSIKINTNNQKRISFSKNSANKYSLNQKKPKIIKDYNNITTSYIDKNQVNLNKKRKKSLMKKKIDKCRISLKIKAHKNHNNINKQQKSKSKSKTHINK
jgi:hypothetical protein